MKYRPIRLLLCSSIGWCVRLTHALTNLIFCEVSANPITPVFLYWVMCQADACTHQLNIQWSFGPLRLFLFSNIQLHVRLTPTLIHWILIESSATPILLSSNMQFSVRLMHALIHWILIETSATPIIPVFQYLIMCQADSYTHQLNIKWDFGHSDHFCILIFDCMSG